MSEARDPQSEGVHHWGHKGEARLNTRARPSAGKEASKDLGWSGAGLLLT